MILNYFVLRMAKTMLDAILGLNFDDLPSNLASAALFYVLTRDVSPGAFAYNSRNLCRMDDEVITFQLALILDEMHFFLVMSI